MPLVAKNSGGGDFTPVPEGTHSAICNMVVDLGLQETTYLGQKKVAHQCYIRWELPQERMEWTDKDGAAKSGPMIIGKTYTLSLADKANLRKDLTAWRGKAFTDEELEGFDLFKLLGVGCQLAVVHKAREGGGVYVNIAGVAGWPKGLPRPQTTEVPMLKYADDEADDFEKLPEWLREKIGKRLAGNHPPTSDGRPPAPELDDDGGPIPF